MSANYSFRATQSPVPFINDDEQSSAGEAFAIYPSQNLSGKESSVGQDANGLLSWQLPYVQGDGWNPQSEPNAAQTYVNAGKSLLVNRYFGSGFEVDDAQNNMFSHPQAGGSLGSIPSGLDLRQGQIDFSQTLNQSIRTDPLPQVEVGITYETHDEASINYVHRLAIPGVLPHTAEYIPSQIPQERVRVPHACRGFLAD
jgi:hypothetical protein